jgi:bidirectional [NiFe] hydrogenase diaphorase subunit
VGSVQGVTSSASRSSEILRVTTRQDEPHRMAPRGLRCRESRRRRDAVLVPVHTSPMHAWLAAVDRREGLVSGAAPPAPDQEGADQGSGVDQRFALLDTALRRARYEPHQLIEILHTAQEIFGHLTEEVLLYVARGLRLPRARVLGVATFYYLFRFEPAGEHTCSVCTGTACFVKGADKIIEALQRTHGVLAGQTTPDGRLSLTTARCIGSCGLAPVIVVDGEILGPIDVRRALDEVASRLRAEATTAGAAAASGEES